MCITEYYDTVPVLLSHWIREYSTYTYNVRSMGQTYRFFISPGNPAPHIPVNYIVSLYTEESRKGLYINYFDMKISMTQHKFM